MRFGRRRGVWCGHSVSGHVGDLTFLEREEALAPRHEIEDRILDLLTYAAIDLALVPGFNSGRPAANARVHDASAVEIDDAFVVAQLRRHAEHARLAAEVQQLEDVVDSKLTQRSFDRHPSARHARAKDALQIARGSNLASGATRELAAWREVDDLPPAVDRVAEAMLLGENGALVVQRSDMIRIEP